MRPVTTSETSSGTTGGTDTDTGAGDGGTRRLSGPALRMTVLLGESDRWHHKPVYTEIVHRAQRAGLAGASVFHGIEGFGGSSLIHTSRLLSLSEDLPVAVIVVDTEERIRGFLPELDELVEEGLVLLDACEVVRHIARPGGTAS
jgi:PII-like signaling protein